MPAPGTPAESRMVAVYDRGETVRKALRFLVVACVVGTSTGCAVSAPGSLASPSPGRSLEYTARTQSPDSDTCANLTADDVRAAIAALPGWSYDFWSTGEALDSTPQPSNHNSAEYIAPDRLREVAWDPFAVRHGSIIIGDRMWWYAGSPESEPFDTATFATTLENVFPFEGTFRASDFPFPGDLPGDGLRASSRVADEQCLATDSNTGISLVTTRSGQLVRMTSEKREDRFIEQRTLIFHATTPPAIEPPSAADLISQPFFSIPARPGPTDPR